MWSHLAADALLVLHFLWIVFLVLGLPLGLYLNRPALRIIHAAGLVFALILQLTHSLCPLTVWEESLRYIQQPDFTYSGSFIITHIERLVYPGWISLYTITLLSALLAGATLLSFILIPLRPKTKQKKHSKKQPSTN